MSFAVRFERTVIAVLVENRSATNEGAETGYPGAFDFLQGYPYSPEQIRMKDTQGFYERFIVTTSDREIHQDDV